MSTGFIYVITSLTPLYEQGSFCNVPTEWKGGLYFGPCKRSMRPRMRPGDYVFGIPSAGASPRRILFAARIEESMTFAQAHERFPELRGPRGPIHVRPIKGQGRFPESTYAHIPGAMHEHDWKRDIASRALDKFFVCSPADGWRNRWLGRHGPEIDEEIMAFLNECPVYGNGGRRAAKNSGTKANPIAHGRLYTGLHLETDRPEELLRLCHARLGEVALPTLRAAPALHPNRGRCDAGPVHPTATSERGCS